jgi:hypothetical protein
MTTGEAQNPIDGVITRLKEIISWSLHQRSRIGYFAALYLRITNGIRSKMGTGYFDDDKRMQLLDAAFAGRYLSAVDQFRAQDPALPAAWAVAFQATTQQKLIIVQHLLLAMNPHINIDLAVAAARTCPGEAISGLHGDFMKINGILTGAVTTVITEIDDLSPFLHLLADLAESDEIGIIDFGLVAARDASWAQAKMLAVLSMGEQEKVIATENAGIAVLSQKILAPGLIGEDVLGIIGSAEVKDVVQIITRLDSADPVSDRPVAAASLPRLAERGKAPNQIYYFQIAPGTWTGSFLFELKSWRRLWFSSMSLKNKLLATSMVVFQKIFGASSISGVLTPYPERDPFGVVVNDFRMFKSWFQLWQSREEYTLSPNGTGVQINAHVHFGPISFLFHEHDIYGATVYDGGMRNLYHIKLLGTRFLGKYQVQPDRQHVRSLLINDWASADEMLSKSVGPNE